MKWVDFSMLHKVKLLLSLILSLFLLACAVTIPSNLQQPDIPKKVLDVPNKGFTSVLNSLDGSILLAVDSGESTSRFYHLDKQGFVDIPVQPDPRCQRRTRYLFPTTLPDKRLGFLMLCGGRWSDRPIGQDGASYIVAYDWNTGSFEQVVADNLPYGASGFTWNPKMSRGIQTVGSLRATIYWLTPQGMEPMTLTLREGNQIWSLDENFAAMEVLDRVDVGIAASPAWSPDGQWVAFLASLDVIGREGLDRARANYKLYLLDPATLGTQPILDGVTDIRGAESLAWSPNNQWLLLYGQIGTRDGLWLVSVSGEIVQFIDTEGPGSIGGMMWVNDRTIIATKCIKLAVPCRSSEVVQYDVSAITQE